jgi:hypothetical protein
MICIVVVVGITVDAIFTMSSGYATTKVLLLNRFIFFEMNANAIEI